VTLEWHYMVAKCALHVYQHLLGLSGRGEIKGESVVIINDDDGEKFPFIASVSKSVIWTRRSGRQRQIAFCPIRNIVNHTAD